MLGACVAMRLKKHEEAIEFAAARSFEGCADFGGVVSVVVDDGYVVYHPLDVEPAPHARELRQPFADQFGGNIQGRRDCRCCCRSADVVHAGRVGKLEQAKIFTFIRQPELAAQTFELHIADYEVGLARCPICNDGSLDAGNDGLDVGFIDAENPPAVKRPPLTKFIDATPHTPTPPHFSKMPP